MDVFIGHLLKEHIAHRVHKDAMGALESQWLMEAMPTIRQIKAVGKRRAAKALGQCFGIAMRTAGTDLHAATPHVPGQIRPADFCLVHCPSPYKMDYPQLGNCG